jgi:hypothetical protein
VEALRKRILREIFVAPSVVIPLVGGASAWLMSWAGGGSDFLNAAGLVGVLGGIGWFATRVIFQMDSLSEKALRDLENERLATEEATLDQLQKRLAGDGDARTESILILLRETRREIERIAQTPGIQLRSLEIVKQSNELFWASIEQLEQSLKMFQLAKKLNGTERQAVLRQRESCLKEARESAEHLHSAVAAFRQVVDKNQVRDLDRLQQDLSDSIEAARRSEERMRELQSTDRYDRMLKNEL